MKISALAKGLISKAVEQHHGDLQVGDVKVHFSQTIADSLEAAKSSVTASITNAIYDKVSAALTNLSSGVPGNLTSQLNGLIGGHISDIINNNVDASFDANTINDHLTSLIDNTLTSEVNNIIGQFASELDDVGAIQTAITTSFNGEIKDILTTLCGDSAATFGKDINDVLASADLKDTLSQALGSGTASTLQSALSSGGKIVLGDSVKSTVLGIGSVMVGNGSKLVNIAEGAMSLGSGSSMIKLAEGAISVAGGALKLGASGIKMGSGSSEISIGSGSISVGGKSISKPKTFFDLAEAANTSWDMSQGPNARLTLTGDRHLDAPSSPEEGEIYTLLIVQDAYGNRHLTYDASIDFGGAGTPTLSTTPSKIDSLSLLCIDHSAPLFHATFKKAS